MDHAKRLAKAAQRYTAAKTERNTAIREAHAAGLSFRAIAQIVGLSHQRVAQIVAGD